MEERNLFRSLAITKGIFVHTNLYYYAFLWIFLFYYAIVLD